MTTTTDQTQTTTPKGKPRENCLKCEWHDKPPNERMEACINCNFVDTVPQTKWGHPKWAKTLSFDFSDGDSVSNADYLVEQIDVSKMPDNENVVEDDGREAFFILLYELRKLTPIEMVVFVRLATRDTVSQISRDLNKPASQITNIKHSVKRKSAVLGSIIHFRGER